ncbi:MAG: hypothetical protein HYT81_13805 [Gemmatimonadetes bacterium]|nr:hypothetical protein [Gemmatimonadota bacterium]
MKFAPLYVLCVDGYGFGSALLNVCEMYLIVFVVTEFTPMDLLTSYTAMIQ